MMIAALPSSETQASRPGAAKAAETALWASAHGGDMIMTGALFDGATANAAGATPSTPMTAHETADCIAIPCALG
jgi:hypothetical protein